MPRRSTSSYVDSIALEQLAEEVDTQPTAGFASALETINDRLCALFRAGGWASVVRHGNDDEEPEITCSILSGVDDWQRRFWNEAFLEGGRYRQHPMMPLVQEGAGTLRARRRSECVGDAEWNAHPFVNEVIHPLHHDDTLAALIPLDDRRELAIALSRPLGGRAFDVAERNLLCEAQQRLRFPLARLLAEEDGTVEARVRLARLLPPRLRRVLAELLTGRSEKEIAGRLGLSTASVHKYVELVYRAFHVRSRPELMALFIDPVVRFE